MPDVSDDHSVAWSACTKIVEAATKACAAAPLPTLPQSLPTPPPIASGPDWNAMANSFASLSVALAWGSLVLAAVALIAALAWGRVVTATAEREARKEAQTCADAYIRRWLVEQAPGIIREHVENLQNATLGTGNDGEAADEMGEAAG